MNPTEYSNLLNEALKRGYNTASMTPSDMANAIYGPSGQQPQGMQQPPPQGAIPQQFADVASSAADMASNIPDLSGGLSNIPGLSAVPDLSNIPGLGKGGFNPLDMIKGKVGEGATPCNKPLPPPAAPITLNQLQEEDKKKITQHIIDKIQSDLIENTTSSPLVTAVASVLKDNTVFIDTIVGKALDAIELKKKEQAEEAQDIPTIPSSKNEQAYEKFELDTFGFYNDSSKKTTLPDDIKDRYAKFYGQYKDRRFYVLNSTGTQLMKCNLIDPNSTWVDQAENKQFLMRFKRPNGDIGKTNSFLSICPITTEYANTMPDAVEVASDDAKLITNNRDVEVLLKLAVVFGNIKENSSGTGYEKEELEPTATVIKGGLRGGKRKRSTKKRARKGKGKGKSRRTMNRHRRY